MISSTSSPDRSPRPDALSGSGQPAARPRSLRFDQISTESAAFLQGALQRQPEIRPEVVARARALAADPDYPSRDIMKRVGEIILGAPDLSEDEA